MLNNTIYSDLTNSIKTTRDLNEISQEIDKLSESIFRTSLQSFDSSLNEISVKTGERIKNTFLKNNLDVSNKETIKDFLISLKKKLQEFKTIKLTIAFEPSHSTIENIYNWVISALDNSFILDIEVNENVLGGAVVVFNGQYTDLTIKKTIKEIFDAKRKEILPQNDRSNI